MIKPSTHYATDRLFLEAVDLEMDMIINERVYDSHEVYLKEIYAVWIELKAYCALNNETLERVDTTEDITGNRMLSIILQFLENKLQS